MLDRVSKPVQSEGRARSERITSTLSGAAQEIIGQTLDAAKPGDKTFVLEVVADFLLLEQAWLALKDMMLQNSHEDLRSEDTAIAVADAKLRHTIISIDVDRKSVVLGSKYCIVKDEFADKMIQRASVESTKEVSRGIPGRIQNPYFYSEDFYRHMVDFGISYLQSR